jgi:hypothetical protein
LLKAGSRTTPEVEGLTTTAGPKKGMKQAEFGQELYKTGDSQG